MKLLLSICLICLYQLSLNAQLTLPKLISDGMVLQRDTPLTIWGWSSVSDTVNIQFNDQNYQAITAQNGQWKTTLSPMEAGGPFQMEVSNQQHKIIISDILIGDVWLCSGQSNMEISMQRVSPLYPKEIQAATNSQIRYFEVPKTYNFKGTQTKINGGKWITTTSETVLNFSAIAYFFADEINSIQNIPIGIINSSLGGSPVDAWLGEKALKKFPQSYKQYKTFQQDDYIDSIQQSDQQRISNWYQTVNNNDLGTQNQWHSEQLDTLDWKSIQMPSFWTTTYPEINQGIVWLRKEFELSRDQTHQTTIDAKLLLGTIVDADSVFVNGTFVGNTSYQYPPRRYMVPSHLLKEGKNTIAIKIINERGRGGMVPKKPYELQVGDSSIDLKGNWSIRQGAKADPLQGQTFVRWEPGGLYNAMISPLLNYRIKGALWYQGESDTGTPEQYEAQFTTLIKTWRENWKQEFPFLYVQLANFMQAKEQPSESNWAALRDAQLKSLKTKNTAMAVTIDIGEWNDIHPLNKKDVAHRLALAARHLTYRESKLIYSGPIYKNSTIGKDKITLSFDHLGSGLISKDPNDPLGGFAIAAADKEFVWAKAKIVGDKIEVWSPEIKNPRYVRYAWADNPDNANLYNKEGLPASPFKTDP